MVSLLFLLMGWRLHLVGLQYIFVLQSNSRLAHRLQQSQWIPYVLLQLQLGLPVRGLQRLKMRLLFGLLLRGFVLRAGLLP